jgi:hypothetical protein
MDAVNAILLSLMLVSCKKHLGTVKKAVVEVSAVHSLLWKSVWERPQTQLLLAHAPQLGQPMRLGNQEPDDQRAEDHELGVRDHGSGDRQPDQIA